jgi:hypothetical protein
MAKPDLVVAPLTPFTSDLKVDETAALRKYLQTTVLAKRAAAKAKG